MGQSSIQAPGISAPAASKIAVPGKIKPTKASDSPNDTRNMTKKTQPGCRPIKVMTQ
jgi:hypothetical protein